MLNVLTLVPPVNDTVKVKLIVVPQTKLGEVLTLKGTVLVPKASIVMSGYPEFG